MNNDAGSSDLEQRLRGEAERLDALSSAPIPLARLGAGYVRARRRSAVRTAAVVLVPALLLFAGWLALTERSGSRTATERSMAQPVEPVIAPNGSRRSFAPVQGSAAESHVAGARLDGQTAGGPSPFAIPIVIIRVEGDRESVVPGFLVPAHDSRVEFRDLSPMEQRAVRQVLDLEGAPLQAI